MYQLARRVYSWESSKIQPCGTGVAITATANTSNKANIAQAGGICAFVYGTDFESCSGQVEVIDNLLSNLEAILMGALTEP